jgi:secondary thiamine-phosphate synthase enzyme
MAGDETGASGAQALGQANHQLTFETQGPGFDDITRQVAQWLDAIGAEQGLLTLFIRHTSASLTIQENADPDVLADLSDCLERLGPEDHPYRHTSEGSDDMPAHIKAMLTTTSLPVPVENGRMVLGTWQGIYLIEHRRRPHSRQIALHFIGAMN